MEIYSPEFIEIMHEKENVKIKLERVKTSLTNNNERREEVGGGGVGGRDRKLTSLFKLAR